MIGSSRYYDVDVLTHELAIGLTFLARSHWGGRVNAEMKSSMLAHAFSWAKRVWFHVGIDNIRSRKAMEKIGARLSHISPRPVNDRPVDHCFYYIDPRWINRLVDQSSPHK
ncbi:MAG: N-acetyltransferase [Limnohabitans sp.]|nr:N-acetyltransferase [Limnohabitans sp.]